MERKDHINLDVETPRSSRRNLSWPNRERINSATDDAEFFSGPDTVNRPRPPVAEPENEFDDQDDDIPLTAVPQPGVDDGFYTPKPDLTPRTNADPEATDDPDRNPNGSVPGRSGSRRRFPQAPDFEPNFVTINGIPTPVPDVNLYQQKKTLAQGMMDLALLSANANQLRYVLESYVRHPYYYFSLIFISISLIFQVAVGVGLILNSRYDVKDRREICKANKVNNLTVVGVFIVTVVNVFISAFGVADPPPDMRA